MLPNHPSQAAAEHNDQSLTEKFLYPARYVSRKKIKTAFSGKTILITGASFGIGEMLCFLLAEADVTLVLVARTGEKLAAIKEKLQEKSSSIYTYCADIREPAQIEDLLNQLSIRSIKPDIFISNAGKSIYRGIEDTIGRFHDISRSNAVNFTGPAQLLLGLLPSLLERKGIIVNVSSVTVLLPHTVGWSSYYATKAAFDHWLKCIRPELAVKKIKIKTVYLPLVRTRMSMVNPAKHTQPAMSRLKAANIILRTIIKNKNQYIPWWVPFIRFVNGLVPGIWYLLQVSRIKRNKQK